MGWFWGRLRLVGRAWFRALRYKPQALQMVSPAGERRHSGVLVVPQLLAFLLASFVGEVGPTGEGRGCSWRCDGRPCRQRTCKPGPQWEHCLHQHSSAKQMASLRWLRASGLPQAGRSAGRPACPRESGRSLGSGRRQQWPSASAVVSRRAWGHGHAGSGSAS